MRRLITVSIVAAAGLSLWMGSPSSQAQMAGRAISASSADDVCAPADDPCLVTSTIAVVDGATLDFGTRAVSMSGGGTFDFSGGSGSILCGDFTANLGSNGVAISARGPDGFGGTQGGFIELSARRACSSGTGRACLNDLECDLGTCSVKRCSGRLNRDCTTNGDCELGPCNVSHRCSGLSSAHCTTNADCSFGTCPASNGCLRSPALLCASDAECDFGTCSIGTGAVNMGGPIVGNADEPAIVIISAAGDVSLSRTINLTGTTQDSDGGEIEVESFLGSVSLTANLTAVGGGFGQGGSVRLAAGQNVTTSKTIDVDGGDFDGGIVELSAGNDVTVANDIEASAVNGEGFGGELAVWAGNDIVVSGTGPTASGTTRLGTEGHEGVYNFGGDGGAQELIADRDVIFGSYAKIQSNGASPDGIGGDVLLDAGRDLLLTSPIEAKALGLSGGGGFMELYSGRDMTVTSSGAVDATGFGSDGGEVDLNPSGDLDFGGSIDVSGASAQGGVAGAVLVDADADVTISGAFFANGASAGVGDSRFDIEACRVHLTSTADLDNRTVNGVNEVTVHESMLADPGSTLSADASTGRNSIIHRAASKPPVLNGTVTPSPVIVVKPSLVGCPVCGNSELDQGETCDDGNTSDGDGCSADCQDEGCIADTPGYPGIDLCDDASGCTTDSCNVVTHSCEHEFLCDDGIDCTVDSCVSDACQHTPDDGACNDGNVCTDDICVAETGCATVNNIASCDDGLFCTDGDACSGGTCIGGGPLDCGDGIACTVDSCDDDGNTCVNTPDDGACSDGAFCNGVETCSAALDCQAGAAVDCSGLDDTCVAGVCDEDADACATEPANEGGGCDDGLSCTVGDICTAGVCAGVAPDCDDGVACTVDSCEDPGGACIHTPADGACGDGVFCNGVETCDVLLDCQAGTPVDCSGLDDACVAGVCDEDADSCTTEPANEAGDCEDGLYCTVGDACSSGVCTGSARDCDDSVGCTVDSCDDDANSCVHTPDDGPCSDGAFCNGVETCDLALGCQAGAAVDCSGLDDTCAAGVCDEVGDACTTEPANEGGGCDDGLFCTGSDACSSGVCTGTQMDCSQLDDVCVAGVCDEISQGCITEPANESGACDDGDACTENDACTAGVCSGDAIPDCAVCGDGQVGGDEQCDDGDTTRSNGEYCRGDCTAVGCGRPLDTQTARPLASEALFTLRAAVHLEICDIRVCDVTGHNGILASDALAILNAAVGAPVVLDCPTTL